MESNHNPTPPTVRGTNVPPKPPSKDACATGGLGAHASTIPMQDLSCDKLIHIAPRMTYKDLSVPSLGGIPLLAKLGQGGMGAVYYGIHPRLHQEVAIKVLPFDLAERNPNTVDRFYREAQLAARIKSPHLVGVLDVNQECGLFYLVMEFVAGGSAQGYLREVKKTGASGLHEAIALDICIAACTGLAAAHAKGVIHRDVKPDNILLPRDDDSSQLDLQAAKLADLGLARSETLDQTTMTKSGACMGTPGYMSPEQAANAKNCGKPSDVFSQGATLYGLLAGQPPFTGESLLKILNATISEAHPPVRELRPDVSAPTGELIDRCLEKDLSRRFVDASALLAALKVCRMGLGEPEKTQQAVARLSELLRARETGQTTRDPNQPMTPTPALKGTIPVPAAPPAPPRKSRAWAWAAVLLLVLMLLGGGGVAAGWHYWPRLKQSNHADVTEPPEDAARKNADAARSAEVRQAFSTAVDAAVEAKRRGDWDGVLKFLEAPLALKENAGHPGRTTAESLLTEAKGELKKRDEAAALAEAERQRKAKEDAQKAVAIVAQAEAGRKQQSYAAKMAEGERELKEQHWAESRQCFEAAKPFALTAAETESVKESLARVDTLEYVQKKADASLGSATAAAAKGEFQSALELLGGPLKNPDVSLSQKSKMENLAAKCREELKLRSDFAALLNSADLHFGNKEYNLALADFTAAETLWKDAPHIGRVRTGKANCVEALRVAAVNTKFERTVKDAQEHQRLDDWAYVQQVLEPGLKDPEIAGHPLFPEAQKLLADSRAQLQRRGEFAQLLASAEKKLQNNDWTGALEDFKGARNAWSNSPDIGRCAAGEVLAQSKLTAERAYTEAIAQVRSMLKPLKRDAEGNVLVPTETECQSVKAAVAAVLKLKADDAEMLALQGKIIATSATLNLGNGETMEFVYVPPGAFKMGADAVPVSMKHGFYIARYTVTVGQFKLFVQETRHKTDAELKGHGYGHAWGTFRGEYKEVDGITWRDPGFKYYQQTDKDPVVLVSGRDSEAFAKWLGDKTTALLKLPTETQWQYAARGPESLLYPWGNEFDGTKCNFYEKAYYNVVHQKYFLSIKGVAHEWNDGYAFTAPVGSYNNASWCGAKDMAGNVIQICAPRKDSPTLYPGCGSSWLTSQTSTPLYYYYNSCNPSIATGFRLVMMVKGNTQE